MRQKLLILFISFYAVGCLCPGKNRKAGIYEVDIISFTEAKLYNVYSTYLDTSPITTDAIDNVDTLGISFNFTTTTQRIAKSNSNFSLINTAYACSSSTDSYSSKIKIDSIIITSDTIYNGINAGASLNALFRYKLLYSIYYNVNGLINTLNSPGNFSDDIFSNIFIMTDIKPDFNTKHKLFIKIYKANSEVIEGETIPFAWY